MTIDEALNLLNNSKPKSNNAFSIQMNEAINVIDVTMRKYKQIERIIEVWHQDIYAKDFECIAEVAEVVEDGND